jgi:hypothetical protein
VSFNLEGPGCGCDPRRADTALVALGRGESTALIIITPDLLLILTRHVVSPIAEHVLPGLKLVQNVTGRATDNHRRG